MITATDNQLTILQSIIRYKELNGYSPSFRNIADDMNVTPGYTYKCCVVLKKKGYITFDEGISRSIIVTKLPESSE